jgi:FixJ family two-component response regulator
MSGSPLVGIVAVVEDDDAARTALGRLLCAAGFEPALFESAEAYIDASPAALCAIVDVQLPGMSGIELQRRLRAAGIATPIIVTTASCDPAVRERAQQNGCAAFFWKPVNGDALMAVVGSLASSLSVHPQPRMTTLRSQV